MFPGLKDARITVPSFTARVHERPWLRWRDVLTHFPSTAEKNPCCSRKTTSPIRRTARPNFRAPLAHSYLGYVVYSGLCYANNPAGRGASGCIAAGALPPFPAPRRLLSRPSVLLGSRRRLVRAPNFDSSGCQHTANASIPIRNSLVVDYRLYIVTINSFCQTYEISNLRSF